MGFNWAFKGLKNLARLKFQKTFSSSEKLNNAVGIITALELPEQSNNFR
jgi:hypothetical protein